MAETKEMTGEEYRSAASFWDRKDGRRMPEDELRKKVFEYLSESSVCALATGYGDYVRCTPLEYSFHDGAFWIFKEGGHKFLALEKNDSVSLAVYDNNPSFGGLRSVQVTGKAEIVEPFSERYVSHAEYKKIPLPALRKLYDEGHPMHLLCIHPSLMEVLFSAFKKDGYDSRQTLSLS